MTVDSLVPCRHCLGYPKITFTRSKRWKMSCDCTTVFEESAASVLREWKCKIDEVQIGVLDLIRGGGK